MSAFDLLTVSSRLETTLGSLSSPYSVSHLGRETCSKTVLSTIRRARDATKRWNVRGQIIEEKLIDKLKELENQGNKAPTAHSKQNTGERAPVSWSALLRETEATRKTLLVSLSLSLSLSLKRHDKKSPFTRVRIR